MRRILLSAAILAAPLAAGCRSDGPSDAGPVPPSSAIPKAPPGAVGADYPPPSWTPGFHAPPTPTPGEVMDPFSPEVESPFGHPPLPAPSGDAAAGGGTPL